MSLEIQPPHNEWGYDHATEIWVVAEKESMGTGLEIQIFPYVPWEIGVL